jgi:hypothetical protein
MNDETLAELERLRERISHANRTIQSMRKEITGCVIALDRLLEKSGGDERTKVKK